MSGLQVAYCDVGETLEGRGSGEDRALLAAGKNSCPIGGLSVPAGWGSGDVWTIGACKCLVI